MAQTSAHRFQRIEGTDAADVLAARSDRAAQISARGGDDTVNGSVLDDLIRGGDGDDIIFNGLGAVGTLDADTLLGGRGDDRIFGSNNDLIDGGAGADFAQVGVNVFDPRVFADGAFIGITSSGALGGGGTLSLSIGVQLTNIETLALTLERGDDRVSTGASADTLRGNGGDDVLSTLGGKDALFGDAGDDMLDGGAGSDRLLGGSGLDTLIGGRGADVFVLDQFGSDTGGQFDSGLDRILDFNVAEGDRFDASLGISFSNGDFVFFDDPFAAGFARITDTAEGALVERLIDQGAFQPGDPTPEGIFVASTLFVGVTVAELGDSFLL